MIKSPFFGSRPCVAAIIGLGVIQWVMADGFVVGSKAVFAASINSQTILKRSDQVKNASGAFEFTNIVTEYVSGKPVNDVTLRIYSKPDPKTLEFRSLLKYVRPPRDQGKIILYSGSKMWFFDPISKASVRISPQQRVLGSASNGDVLSVNFAKDYIGEVLGEESVQDPEHKTHLCWHLKLKPSGTSAMYQSIDYWVEQKTFHPQKAKFYSDSGRLLKIAFYHKYSSQLGALRPTEVILVDGVNATKVTTIATESYESKVIPDSWFQLAFLPHLANQ